MLYLGSKSSINLVLLITIITMVCQGGLQKKFFYSTDIKKPQQIDLSSSPIDSVDLEGQVTNQFLIKSPKQIGEIMQIQIHTKDSDKINSVQSSSAFVFPDIQEIKFQGLSWPAKKNTLFYSILGSYFEDTADQNNDNDVEIVSATNSHILDKTGKQIYYPIYVLLSNGTLLTLRKQQQNLILSESYNYPSQAKPTLTNWYECQLYHRQNQTYLLCSSTLYQIVITLGSLKYELVQSTTLNVLKVIQDRNYLYLFTKTNAYKIGEDKSVQSYLDFQELNRQFNFQKDSLNLIDYYVCGNQTYLLDRNNGIIWLKQNYTGYLLNIQNNQLAQKINVKDHTILVTYQVGQQNIIGQYIFDVKGQRFFLNKYYTKFGQVDSILLFDNFFITDRGSDVTLSMYQLNRNFPLAFHIQSENMQTNGFNNVLRISKLSQDMISCYMITTPTGIQLIQFPISTLSLHQKQLKLHALQSGSYQLTVKFRGTCKDSSDLNNATYCTLKKNINVNVKDTIKQIRNIWWIWLIGAVALVLILILSAIFIRMHFINKREQYEDLISKRPTSSIHLTDITQNSSELKEKS